MFYGVLNSRCIAELFYFYFICIHFSKYTPVHTTYIYMRYMHTRE